MFSLVYYCGQRSSSFSTIIISFLPHWCPVLVLPSSPLLNSPDLSTDPLPGPSQPPCPPASTVPRCTRSRSSCINSSSTNTSSSCSSNNSSWWPYSTDRSVWIDRSIDRLIDWFIHSFIHSFIQYGRFTWRLVVKWFFMSTATVKSTRVRVWVLQLHSCSRVLFHEYEYRNEYSNSIVVVEYRKMYLSTSMSTPTL